MYKAYLIQTTPKSPLKHAKMMYNKQEMQKQMDNEFNEN